MEWETLLPEGGKGGGVFINSKNNSFTVIKILADRDR